MSLLLQVYISSRTAKDCDATASELNTMGPGECIPVPADMQKVSEIERLVSEISKKEKMLNVLVNNAGANWAESIDTFTVSCCQNTLANLYVAHSVCFYLTGCSLLKGHDIKYTKGFHVNAEMPPASSGSSRCWRT